MVSGAVNYTGQYHDLCSNEWLVYMVSVAMINIGSYHGLCSNE